MKVYLAGPMRGVPYWNFPAFDAATGDLRAATGWTVFSPAEHDRTLPSFPKAGPSLDGGSFGDLAACLEWDFARIAESDAIVVLPGWETSTGVHWEMTVAHALGKEILSYPDFKPIEVPSFISNPASANRVARFDVTKPYVGSTDSVKWTSNPGPQVPVSIPSGEYEQKDAETGAKKNGKLARTDLLPTDVLLSLAEHYGRGAQKYADRNWEAGYPWSWSLSALLRHLFAWQTGEDLITDDPIFAGVSHLDAVVWHAVALRAFELRDIGTDDRPLLP